MNNYGKLFSGELNNWLIYEAGFKQSYYQISIYYKYTPDGFRIVLLSYVYNCLYWYIYEEIG